MRKWLYLSLSLFLLLAITLPPVANADHSHDERRDGPPKTLTKAEREELLEKYEKKRGEKRSKPKATASAKNADYWLKDVTFPEVMFTNPIDTGIEVPLNIVPAITFNAPIKLGDEGGVWITPMDGGYESFQADVKVANNTLYVLPEQNWKPNTVYYIDVMEGTVVNANRPDYPNISYSFSFETGNQKEPVVKAVSPYEMYPLAELDTEIKFTFDRNLVKGTGKFFFEDLESNTVDATLTVKGDTITIKPKELLSPNTLYFVGVLPGTAKDRSGNPSYPYLTMIYTGSLDEIKADLQLTVEKKKSVKLKIQGGQAPYKAESSKPSVAKTSVSGSNLTITGVNTGVAMITVRDKDGDPFTIKVLVQDYIIKFQ